MKIRYYKSDSNYKLFGEHLQNLLPYTRPIVILCIGTDRCSGDSLGPLIGYKLENLNLSNIKVYGTLNSPVHALNLCDTIDLIYDTFVDPFILAIDASLGQKDHIGRITLSTGPLIPGLGVGKSLPKIGDIHITGIVNFKSRSDSLILQTTRLNTVMNMADFIVNGICHSLCMSHAFVV